MKISFLNENTANKRGFLGELGLSLLIEWDGGKILFDTGPTDVFLRNAARMGADLEGLSAIVLSHGHFDHCGGLEYLLEGAAGLPPVYVRRSAFEDKQAVNADGKTYRKIGIPWREELKERRRELLERSIRWSGDRMEIFPGVHLLGNIPYTVDFEGRPGNFFVETGGAHRPDYMDDEQLLVIETEKGLSIFAGCSHPGIVNCVEYVRKCLPGRPIYSLVAGMHLLNSPRARVEQTIEALRAMDIPVLVPVHCTGILAIARMKEAFGETCRLAEAGMVVEI